MATAEPHSSIPTFTVHDRCRKAREHADLEQDDLAERTGISRSTISNYETGATTSERVKPTYLKLWALACGVNVEWLRTGTPGPDTPDEQVDTPTAWNADSVIDLNTRRHQPKTSVLPAAA